MRYLVSTTNSLMHVDSRRHAIHPVHTGDGLYYGIADDGEYFYVAARRRKVSSTIARAEERGCILVFNRQLRHITTWQAPFPLRDMHQVLWWRGKLWVTCSFDNMVAVTDGREWQRWYPLGMPTQEPYDRHHFNSLSAVGDDLVMVAHNFGASELLFFDPDQRTLRKRLPLGMQAHNVWRQGEEWLTCSSADGRLIGSRGFRLRTGEFPRGFAATKAETAIGLSKKAERDRRDFTHGAIHFYDTKWRRTNTLKLPGSGLVLDILPLDGTGASLDLDAAQHVPEHLAA